MNFFIFLIDVLLLTCAMSIDSLVSGVAYGSNKIKVPWCSMLIINLVCILFLSLSLFFGSYISQYIPYNVTMWTSIVILIILGLIKIFDSFIKNLIKKYKEINKDIHFSLFSLKLTLNLYAKPEESDFDHSKIISIKEAVAIAIALSIDGITLGFGAGLVEMDFLKGSLIITIAFLLGIVALWLGVCLGEKIASKIKMNVSWIGGLLLIIIAICKIFN